MIEIVVLAGLCSVPLRRVEPSHCRDRRFSLCQPVDRWSRFRGGAGESLLSQASTLSFDDSLPWLRYIRTSGVRQFISTFIRQQDSTGDELLWGDEIEYHIISTNTTERTVRLCLRANTEVLPELSAKEERSGRRDGLGEACSWHPEYGAWMVEGTPRVPYGGFTSDLSRVEPNMRLRRKRLLSMLKEGEIVVTVPAFPLMGVGHFTEPYEPPGGPSVGDGASIPDALISPVPRFHTLTANIRRRRGSKVCALFVL